MKDFPPAARSAGLQACFAGALLFVLGAATAAAQVPTAEAIGEIRKGARVHAGALYLTPSIELRELGIESNVFNAAGDQESDFMFNVAPRLRLWVPAARRALFSASAATELVW